MDRLTGGGAENRPLSWALAYASRLDWRVLPVEPDAKRPLTPNGVNDATTDLHQIMAWRQRWPDANVGIATGYPGPHVLDIDAVAKFHWFKATETAPTVATPRPGRHHYFEGNNGRTIKLDYGELRGVGSYVVAPPSIVNGREYVWTLAPTGALPPVPDLGERAGRRCGVGELEALPEGELIPYGQRHPYLCGVCAHLLRAGITDKRRLLAHLRCEFELSCEPLPEPEPGSIESLAMWGPTSDIAKRERALEDYYVIRAQARNGGGMHGR